MEDVILGVSHRTKNFVRCCRILVQVLVVGMAVCGRRNVCFGGANSAFSAGTAGQKRGQKSYSLN
jgi:hypothetical protein